MRLTISTLSRAWARYANCSVVSWVADEWGALRGSELRALATRREQTPANWKIVADAFLETYHLRTIHARSVAKLLDHRGGLQRELARRDDDEQLRRPRGVQPREQREEVGERLAAARL